MNLIVLIEGLAVGAVQVYKTTYGALLQEYVTSYETTGEMYKLQDNEFVLASDTKRGHSANLLSFRIEWLMVGRHQAKHLPRKKKKRLARLHKLKYTKIRKLIDKMED